MSAETTNLVAEVAAAKLVLELLLKNLEALPGGLKMVNNVRNQALGAFKVPGSNEKVDPAIAKTVRQYFERISPI